MSNSSSQLWRKIRVQRRCVTAALIGLNLLLHAELQPELVDAAHILFPGVDVEAVVEEVSWVCPWHPPGGLHHPVRIKIKYVAMAQSQELLVLLWRHSGLAWQPDQLVLTCLRR